MDNKRRYKLTPKLNKEINTFVDLFTNEKNKKTYSKQNIAATESFKGIASTTATSKVSKMLNDNTSHLSKLVNKEIAKQGLGIGSRLTALKNIIANPIEEQTHYDADNNVVSRTVKKSVAHSLKAIDQVSKLSGDYAKADAQVNLQSETLSIWLKANAKRLLDNK
jgi:hypothetical protein